MNKPSVIVRADGGASLGMGHLARAAALAAGLEKKGYSPLIVLKNAEPAVLDYLKKAGFAPLNFMTGEERNWEDEAHFIAALADEKDAAGVILDLDNAETRENIRGYARYTEILKNTARPVAALDGPYGEGIYYDSLVVPYVGADRAAASRTERARLFLGPDYFIFREEFQIAAKKERVIREKADRILITMGGSDPGRLTLKAVSALAGAPQAWRVKIVAGAAFSGDLKSALKSAAPGERFEILETPPDMAALMLWCDAAVISGGLTKYELAATGTPGISLAQHEEEDRLTALFAAKGSIKHLGMGSAVPEQTIAQAAAGLLNNFKERQAMASAGKKLVDGRGLERVLREAVLVKAEHRRAV